MTSLNKQAAQCLENAAMVLQLPGWWTKDAFARNDAGYCVDLCSPSACSFCAQGALEAAAADYVVEVKARNALERHIRPSDVLIFWNDCSESPERVVRAMLETAEKLRGQS